MVRTKNVIIMGRTISLKERNKEQLKGISVGDKLSYCYFDGMYYGIPLLFVEPRDTDWTPRVLDITGRDLTTRFNVPVVFILPSCPAYERQRLIDKGVYFVVSDKYAYLPMLLANERERKTRKAKVLTPAAQYLLLYHLQMESLEGLAARDLEGKMPYSYATIALAITCLDDLGLCAKVADGSKRKILHFVSSGKELWTKAQPYLISPIDKRIYCDKLLSEEQFPVCGINALSHYTHLNADAENMVMMNIRQMQTLNTSGALLNANELDGDVVIETWKYPPVTAGGWNAGYVDKLSLAISLREDEDPRVEGAVEYLINKIEWKD